MNPNGIRFYSGLIDELIKHGIHPVATLYHWDLPLPLQIENDGWLSHKTANAFVAYARVCFERFGDRVKHWITLNEPANHAVYGYARGDHAAVVASRRACRCVGGGRGPQRGGQRKRRRQAPMGCHAQRRRSGRQKPKQRASSNNNRV